MRINITCLGTRFRMYRNLTQLLWVSLAELGHDVSVTENRMENKALNLMLPPMGFRLPGLPEALAANHVRYVVIGIEPFDGYAHVTGPGETDLGPFRQFLAAADAIWCPFHDDVAKYRPLSPHVQAMRYGFHPALREIPDHRERPTDIFFFGSVDAYPARKAFLERLEARGLRVRTSAVFGDTPTGDVLLRNAEIARAKIQLNLPHGDHASPQRVVYLANNAQAVFSAACRDTDGYLGPATVFDDETALKDGIAQAVADGSWREAGERGYQEASQWPMTEILEKLLDRG